MTEKQVINLVLKSAGYRFAGEPYQLKEYLASEEFLRDIILAAPSRDVVPVTCKKLSKRVGRRIDEVWQESILEAKALNLSDEAETLAVAKIRQFYKGYLNPIDPPEEQIANFLTLDEQQGTL